MHESGVGPDTMKEYVDGFRWGCPPVCALFYINLVRMSNRVQFSMVEVA